MQLAAVLVGSVGVVFVIAGIVVLVRFGRSPAPVARVAVPAVKLRRIGLSRPQQLEFDYPAPDGQRLQARAYAPMSVLGMDISMTPRGGPLTVYVNPADPSDVVLAPDATTRRAPRLVAIILMFLGANMLFTAMILSLMASVMADIH